MDYKHKPQEAAAWMTESRKSYNGQFSVGGNRQGYYTKKRLKSLYPKGNYTVVGEFAAHSKKEKIGIMQMGGASLPIYRYRAHSRLLYREKGSAAVGKDSYVMLLKGTAAIRVMCLLLIAALITAGVLFGPGLLGLGTQTATNGTREPVQTPDLEQGAVDWEGSKPQNTGGVVPGIAIPGYKSITIAANQTNVKVNFQNPAGNPCYFVISLILDDSTVLYQSKMIEPGMGLYDITLTQPLSSGEYAAVVKYETYSLDNLTPMNGAQVQIALIVQ